MRIPRAFDRHLTLIFSTCSNNCRILMTLPEKDPSKVRQLLQWQKSLPKESQNSFERAFYTLQTKAYLLENFTSKSETKPRDVEIVEAFATSVNALLRKAHTTRTCDYHKRLFAKLGGSDTIISFNYNLVAERALKRTEPNMRAPPLVHGFIPWAQKRITVQTFRPC